MNQLDQFDSSVCKNPSSWRELHDAYMLSDHWQDLRLRCFARYGHRCEACKSKRFVQGHHLIYRDPIERGEVEDIMPLCDRCHRKWHDYLKRSNQTLGQHDRTSTAQIIRNMLRHKSDAPIAKVKKSKKQRRRERELAKLQNAQPQYPKYKVEMNLRPPHEVLETVVFEQGKVILKLQQLCADLQARVSILEQRNP